MTFVKDLFWWMELTLTRLTCMVGSWFQPHVWVRSTRVEHIIAHMGIYLHYFLAWRDADDNTEAMPLMVARAAPSSNQTIPIMVTLLVRNRSVNFMPQCNSEWTPLLGRSEVLSDELMKEQKTILKLCRLESIHGCRNHWARVQPTRLSTFNGNVLVNMYKKKILSRFHLIERLYEFYSYRCKLFKAVLYVRPYEIMKKKKLMLRALVNDDSNSTTSAI